MLSREQRGLVSRATLYHLLKDDPSLVAQLKAQAEKIAAGYALAASIKPAEVEEFLSGFARRPPFDDG